MIICTPPAHRRPVSPPGHRAAVWEPRLDGGAPARLEELVPAAVTGGVLVIAGAHPDDESIGAGRLISQWRRDVGRVVAVLASAGEACVDHVMTRPAGIARRRLAEWDAALDRLMVTERERLDLPDGGLATHERALTDGLRARLAATDRVVALAAPSRIDPHPDHQAVGRAAASAARERGIVLLEYPVWLTYWADPVELGSGALVRVRTDPVAESERAAALRCFATQLCPLADDVEPVVPATMLDHHLEQRLVLGVGR